tara:strand:+ start:5750 stop:6121 length:372 start_codon:yes stop_codon:yes gene_type:complete
MALAANNQYTLDVHSPKKSTVVTVGYTTPGPTEVSIHIGSSVNVGLMTSMRGVTDQCLRLALNEMPNIVMTSHCPMGGVPELDGILTADDITISIGSTTVAQEQTGFLVRTVTRLNEYITEDA